MPDQTADKTVRYAVVGLGHIAQTAVLPAFQHAANATLVALVDDDDKRLDYLAKRYGARIRVHTDRFDELVCSGDVDALYIAVPNHLHCTYAVRALRAGVHTLCEKPMAVTEEECTEMIRAGERSGAKLMVAYRLHFERANLEAMNIVRNGELGDPRLFTGVLSQTVRSDDVRLQPIARGGGATYDVGIYCINAARYMFRDEPTQVTALTELGTESDDGRAELASAAVLRFPNERLALFAASFDVARLQTYRVLGTEGILHVSPAFHYETGLGYSLDRGGETISRHYGPRDQFGAELIYFSDCISRDEQPEPDGYEGLADVRIIRAIHRSAKEGRAIDLPPYRGARYPEPGQVISCPPIQTPPELHASGPSSPN